MLRLARFASALLLTGCFSDPGGGGDAGTDGSTGGSTGGEEESESVGNEPCPPGDEQGENLFNNPSFEMFFGNEPGFWTVVAGQSSELTEGVADGDSAVVMGGEPAGEGTPTWDIAQLQIPVEARAGDTVHFDACMQHLDGTFDPPEINIVFPGDQEIFLESPVQGWDAPGWVRVGFDGTVNGDRAVLDFYLKIYSDDPQTVAIDDAHLVIQ